jgi:ABC-type uncharacterized transport system YnjBCD permease subunit
LARPPKRFLIVALAIAVVLGVAFGSVATYAALQHNPQEVFRDTESGRIHFDAVAPVFLLNAFVVSLATFVVATAIYSVVALAFRMIGRVAGK